MADAGVLSRCLYKKDTAQLCGVSFFVDGTLLWEWRARQQCGAACGSVKKLQIQFAGELVDDVVSCALFGLDVYLAGLHTDLVGGAVVCLGAVDDVGDVGREPWWICGSCPRQPELRLREQKLSFQA